MCISWVKIYSSFFLLVAASRRNHWSVPAELQKEEHWFYSKRMTGLPTHGANTFVNTLGWIQWTTNRISSMNISSPFSLKPALLPSPIKAAPEGWSSEWHPALRSFTLKATWQKPPFRITSYFPCGRACTRGRGRSWFLPISPKSAVPHWTPLCYQSRQDLLQ